MSPRVSPEWLYPEAAVGGFTHHDGTLAFYMKVNSLIEPDSTVVDVGCGRGAYGADPVRVRREQRILKGRAARVIGIDVDPAGESNPYLDEFRRIEPGQPWPLADASADLCLADNVIEHLPDPAGFFRECHRVLKPGGWFCGRTPNRASYFGVISSMIPNRYHAKLVSRVQKGREEQDVFPTLYRANTSGSLRRALRGAGFDEAIVYGYEPEPSYLSFSRLAYLVGATYGKVAPRALRTTLFAFARRGA